MKRAPNHHCNWEQGPGKSPMNSGSRFHNWHCVTRAWNLLPEFLGDCVAWVPSMPSRDTWLSCVLCRARPFSLSRNLGLHKECGCMCSRCIFSCTTRCIHAHLVWATWLEGYKRFINCQALQQVESMSWLKAKKLIRKLLIQAWETLNYTLNKTCEQLNKTLEAIHD